MSVSPVEHAEVLLRQRAGLKAEEASRARLERLLHESASLAGIPMHSYVDLVVSHPAAFDDLLDRVTVQHSGFFRDPAQFVALGEVARDAGSAAHTVWSAGCGNGQEPYSLAMLLDEARRPNWHIVATDVSFHALARAEKGLFTEREIQGLSPERRSKYLTPAPGGYEIAGFLRRKVRFAHHNLSGDDAESLVPEPQVVFCRNVLMYFGREESEACIKRIADRLVAGGHLFLGHSDSPGRMTGYFEPILVAGARCYRRLTAAQPAAPVAGRRQGDLRPPADLHSLLVEGDHAAAAGDLRSAIRAFRSATYLDPDQAVSYFQLASALELAGDEREARRAFAAAGLAMMSEGANGDLSALGGFTRRDLARAIASKLAEDT